MRKKGPRQKIGFIRKCIHIYALSLGGHVADGFTVDRRPRRWAHARNIVLKGSEGMRDV